MSHVVNVGPRIRRTLPRKPLRPTGLAAVVLAGLGAASALAQNGEGACSTLINGESLSQPMQASIQDWATHLFNRVDNGVPDTGSAFFAFPESCANADTFSPLHGAMVTLRQLGVVSGDCDTLGSLAGDPTFNLTPTQYDLIRLYLTEGTLVTNIITQPEESVMLIGMYFNAPTDANVTIAVEGDMLICTNIPPGSLEGYESWPVIVQNLSPESNDLVLGVIQNFGGIVSNVNASSFTHTLAGEPDLGFGVHEAVKLISGEPSRADLIYRSVALMLHNQWPDVDSTVQRIDACWGTYGSLPLLAISLPDAYILLDTTNGLMAGPFEPGSDLHANALLAQHEEWDGTNPAYYNQDGCQTPTLAGWLPYGLYPGTFTPIPGIPGALPRPMIPPWGGPPITINPSLPGWNTTPVCINLPAVGAVCTEYRQMRDAAGRIIFIMNVFSCPTGTVAPAVPPCTSGGSWVWF